MLDVWPVLPLIVMSDGWSDSYVPRGKRDSIIAALECTDRVYHMDICIAQSLDLDIFLAMQQPFPELRHLELRSDDGTVAVVPDSFLGGSAPRLQYLKLYCIPYLGLPNLLLTATHLVILKIHGIPHSGYISPDAMVAALSTLASLEHLSLEFESPRSCPDQASCRPPPLICSVLPVLTHFRFKGVAEYLEDLVACIDAPQLNRLYIIFSHDIVFDTPQLVRFISHTPKSKAFQKAYITLDNYASVGFSSQTSPYREFTVTILCKGLDWQVSSLEQVCTSCLPPLSMLEDLYFIKGRDIYAQPDWEYGIENGQWLELFRSFMPVKNLYLSEKFVSLIAPALRELVEGRVTEVLPALQNIFLKGLESSRSVQESIRQFVAARQVTNHPICISPWTGLVGG